MKTILRIFLINLAALYLSARLLPGLMLNGGLKTLITASIAFMFINLLIVPLLRIMFLPLNLLTLGIFSWAVNVLALYFLTLMVPQFKIVPFEFPGANLNGFIIPSADLSTLYVAIIASFLIGLITHLMLWISK